MENGKLWKITNGKWVGGLMAEIENSNIGIAPGAPVIVNLQSPREKVWGVLRELTPAGVFVRGIDLNTFDDWVQMIVRGERNMGLTHVFLPMWRVERVSLDESVDEIPSLAAQFYARVGLTVSEYLDAD
jgi:hypothetical protein